MEDDEMKLGNVDPEHDKQFVLVPEHVWHGKIH